MDSKIAEAVGLLRHQIISPVLMDSGRSQMDYFRSLEDKEFDVPGSGTRKFKAPTMKMWLNKYKKHGFAGITPKLRNDVGGYRKINPQMQQEILELRKDNSEISVIRFYELCIKKEILGIPPICVATVRRFLKSHELAKPKTITVRKRFEMSVFGELWTGDYMHGPKIIEGKKKRKAILFAVIDDHSRFIVGSEFGLHENTVAIEKVFKNALATHGLPDRIYLDNGPSFSSHYLSKVCAHLNIGLVHSKPYDSPSRGKIERYFRTVRESFLVGIKGDISLGELNARFNIWLRDDYHHRVHQGIGVRPIDRYTTSLTQYPRKRIDVELLNEYFMVRINRMVKKDSTLSYMGRCYDAPARYIGLSVEIRHLQNDYSEIYIYENDIRVAQLHPVDVVENGKIFRPKTVEQVSFTKGDRC